MTVKNSFYQGAEAQVYEDAMLLVPGVAAARQRGSWEDVNVLYDGYLTDAETMGVPARTAWSILSVCQMHWIGGLYEDLALARNETFSEVIAFSVQSAADWAATGGQ